MGTLSLPTPTGHKTPGDTPGRSPACGPLICCTVLRVLNTHIAIALYTFLCYHGAHRGGSG